jgi:hypothetical protein
MSKDEIFALTLESLGIKLLTQGVKQHNRRTMGEKLLTVGDVCRKYPYRLRTRMHKRYNQEDLGAGKDTINEFKSRLAELGLTADDWPGLVPHNELLLHLSKEEIMKLPVREVLTTYDDYFHSRLCVMVGCDDTTNEKWRVVVTVKNLILVDPHTYSSDTQRYLIQPYKRRFMVLRMKLVARGFNESDGPFFKWNPEPDAIWKAEKILRAEGIKGKSLKRFAQIAVNRGWVT